MCIQLDKGLEESAAWKFGFFKEYPMPKNLGFRFVLGNSNFSDDAPYTTIEGGFFLYKYTYTWKFFFKNFF